MSDTANQNTTIDDNISTDDLDDFSATFFGQKDAEPPKDDEANVTEEVDEVDEPHGEEDDDGATTELDDAEHEDVEDDALDEENNDEEDEDEEAEPKPKKNRFQDRINELTEARRKAERERDELLQRIEALEKPASEKDIPGDPTKTDPVEPDLTGLKLDPYAKNEDGSDKYPLGEYDPQYTIDQTLHTIKWEREQAEKRQAEETQRLEQDAAQAALQTEWNEKLVTARERYPDFQEKGQSLVESFGGLNESYGEYLTTTIMSMDYGTDVLYYLANNPDEAKAIVDSGARKATIALGRLEAEFAGVDKSSTTNKTRLKASKAPPPPPKNKGSAVARARVDPDTDDLDAFSNEFFKK